MKLTDHFDKPEITLARDWGVFDIPEMILTRDLGRVRSDTAPQRTHSPGTYHRTRVFVGRVCDGPSPRLC